MKHFLNFVPTVKFRIGSSLMFRAVMVLIYAVPALLAAFMAYQYYDIEALMTRYKDFGKGLEDRHDVFQKELTGNRPDYQEMKHAEEVLGDYHRILTGFSFSWSRLFEILETTVPAGVHLQRISIVPNSVLRINILGVGADLPSVTGFVRSLYQLDRFSQPRLLRHALTGDKTESARDTPRKNLPGEGTVQFSLRVDYLPEIEVQP